jgi:hypothetical protein
VCPKYAADKACLEGKRLSAIVVDLQWQYGDYLYARLLGQSFLFDLVLQKNKRRKKNDDDDDGNDCAKSKAKALVQKLRQRLYLAGSSSSCSSGSGAANAGVSGNPTGSSSSSSSSSVQGGGSECGVGPAQPAPVDTAADDDIATLLRKIAGDAELLSRIAEEEDMLEELASALNSFDDDGADEGEEELQTWASQADDDDKLVKGHENSVLKAGSFVCS